jgi:antitoxin component YwqK of YwqJK toxin-antitoxin module
MATKKHTQYHKDGTLWGKGTMKDGKMHGYWEWFRKDGTKMRSGHFDNDKQVLEWITYDKKGNPYKTTIMASKKRNSK